MKIWWRDNWLSGRCFIILPYYRMVYVYLKNRNETLLDVMAHTMAEKLRALFGNRILGPDKPPVARIQTLFIRKIVVKIEQNAPMKSCP